MLEDYTVDNPTEENPVLVEKGYSTPEKLKNSAKHGAEPDSDKQEIEKDKTEQVEETQAGLTETLPEKEEEQTTEETDENDKEQKEEDENILWRGDKA